MSQKIENFLNKYGSNLPAEAIAELRLISLETGYFEKVFNNSPCTISVINEDGIYVSANKKMLSVLNLELKDIVGKKVGEITKDGNIAKLFAEAQSGNSTEEKYYVLETSLDGERKQFWISVNKVGSKFLIIGSDVTDYKNLEQEKMFSDKMAFLGEMSTFIVHEINNPLMTISMANEIIQMNAVNEQMVKNTEDIGIMVDTIAKIIESLKIFSRRDTNQEVEVCLDSLFERSKMILGGKIKNSGVKVLPCNLKDVKVKGSEVEFLQILVNLISNSIDAVKNNEEKWVKVEWSGNALKIIDSGKGIPPQVIPNLFKKFYTSKGNKGNGIGLYLSRELLNKWGFDLIYKLEEGHTSFQWVLK